MHGKKVYQRWDLKIDGIILTNRDASSGLNSEWPPVQKKIGYQNTFKPSSWSNITDLFPKIETDMF